MICLERSSQLFKNSMQRKAKDGFEQIAVHIKQHVILAAEQAGNHKGLPKRPEKELNVALCVRRRHLVCFSKM